MMHEEAGAFAASAQAKLSGTLAVCVGTAGPGAIHLLNGLYDAKKDHAPVLAITGQTSTSLLGTNYQQEVNLTALFQDVSVYNQMIVDPHQMPDIINTACQMAIIHKGVAHINLPLNISSKHVKSAERKKIQDATLRKISRLVAPMQDVALTAVNKLRSQRKTISAEPIPFDDPFYKTLARSVRNIASNVDKIVAEYDKTSEKNKSSQQNEALDKIASFTKQLNEITTPIVQDIHGTDKPCPPLIEAGSNDAGIDLEKEGKAYSSKHSFVSCDFKRTSTW